MINQLYAQKTYNDLFGKRFLLRMILLAGIILLALTVHPTRVFAAGGVGSGGDGTTDSSAGHYTAKGWGWVRYDVNGPGPTDGFRDGTQWSSVQATCKNANATNIYTHVILDSQADAMSYNYNSVQTNPYLYPGGFVLGIPVDHNRAVSIGTDTAKAAFDSLGSYGINTSNFTFGVNVAWFCYDYQTDTTVKVFKYYPNSHSADGNTASNPAAIKNAQVCIDNDTGWPNRPCGPGNTYTYSGIALKNNDYFLEVSVPNGYRLSKAKHNGNDASLTCSAAGNTGSCTVKFKVTVQDPNYVDLWFEDAATNLRVFKYYPADHAANGVTSGYPAEVNGIELCLSNTVDTWWKACSGSNTPQFAGLLIKNNNYTLTFFVPPGYTFDRAKHNGNNPVLAVCNSENNTLKCVVTFRLGMSDPKDPNHPNTVDLWFGRAGDVIEPDCANVSLTNSEPGQMAQLKFIALTKNNVATQQDVKFKIDSTAVGDLFEGYHTNTKPLPVIPANKASQEVFSKSFPLKSIGEYNFTYDIAFPDLPPGPNNPKRNCPATVKIEAKPFFKAQQGDIVSGFKDVSCDNGWSSSDGKLVSWYEKNNGSGTTLATLALSIIEGVASRQQNPPPELPNELAFANLDIDSGSYGGNYRATISCPKNYYGRSASLTPASVPGGIPSSDTLVSGNIVFQGGSIASSSGIRSVLYVSGDAYITGNILLNNSTSDITKLNNFYLVAKGNIYIAPSVTQLDGVYIAQGRGGTGKIYTCAHIKDGVFGPPTAEMLASDTSECRKNPPLTVNGAFIADTINLYRSFGTLSQNKPAEIFNYTPSVWLAPPKSIAPLFTGGDGTPGGKAYDAITTLQPVL